MKTTKITRKGQITIPVEFRKKLGTDLVEIEMQEEKVIIKPVKKIGGIFHRYALKDKPIEEILKMEKEAVNNAFREKHSNR